MWWQKGEIKAKMCKLLPSCHGMRNISAKKELKSVKEGSLGPSPMRKERYIQIKHVSLLHQEPQVVTCSQKTREGFAGNRNGRRVSRQCQVTFHRVFLALPTRQIWHSESITVVMPLNGNDWVSWTQMAICPIGELVHGRGTEHRRHGKAYLGVLFQESPFCGLWLLICQPSVKNSSELVWGHQATASRTPKALEGKKR